MVETAYSTLLKIQRSRREMYMTEVRAHEICVLPSLFFCKEQHEKTSICWQNSYTIIRLQNAGAAVAEFGSPRSITVLFICTLIVFFKIPPLCQSHCVRYNMDTRDSGHD